jgi:hypothetical protein
LFTINWLVEKKQVLPSLDHNPWFGRYRPGAIVATRPSLTLHYSNPSLAVLS